MADDFLIEGGGETAIQRVFHQDQRPKKQRVVNNVAFDEDYRYRFTGTPEHFEQFAAIMESYCIFPEEGDEVPAAADEGDGQSEAGAGGQGVADPAADQRPGGGHAPAGSQGGSASGANGGSAERQEVKDEEEDDFV